jgi:hypothetical protein
MKPGAEPQTQSANRITNNKTATNPDLRTVAVDLRIIAKKVAIVQTL